MLGVGVFDQTAPRYTPDYAGTTAAESVVHDFVARAMQVLPAGTAVLQLPYLPYPENGPINGMGDYEQIRPYLSSPDSPAALRWSYGAVKGSPDDWLGAYSGGPLRLLLDVASVNGFGAIYVDQLAFKDRGAEVAAVLTAELGPAIARSRDDRMVMWDLGPYAAQVLARLDPQQRAAARQAGLHPTRGTMGVTFGAASAAMMTGRVVRDARPVAHVDLANDLKTGQRLALDVGLSRAGPSGTSAHLAFPDGTSLDVPLGDEPVRYIHVFTAPPGVSHIELTSVGGALGTDRSPAPVVLKLVDPLLVPVEVCLGRPLDTTVGACTTGPRPQVP